MVGTQSNREGVSTALKLVSEGFTQYGQRKGDMSYMSPQDPRVHFGLGHRKDIDLVEITWPRGTVDRLIHVLINHVIAAKQGAGTIPRSFSVVSGRSKATRG